MVHSKIKGTKGSIELQIIVMLICVMITYQKDIIE